MTSRCDAGAAAQQGSAFPFRHATPHAEPLALVEGVDQALQPDRAGRAHCLGSVLCGPVSNRVSGSVTLHAASPRKLSDVLIPVPLAPAAVSARPCFLPCAGESELVGQGKGIEEACFAEARGFGSQGPLAALTRQPRPGGCAPRRRGGREVVENAVGEALGVGALRVLHSCLRSRPASGTAPAAVAPTVESSKDNVPGHKCP